MVIFASELANATGGFGSARGSAHSGEFPCNSEIDCEDGNNDTSITVNSIVSVIVQQVA